jgi:hypothetical protein
MSFGGHVACMEDIRMHKMVWSEFVKAGQFWEHLDAGPSGRAI